MGTKNAGFQYANKIYGMLYKNALNMVLEKTSYFLTEKVDFRGVPPYVLFSGFIIIRLVEKKDILKMSKNNSMEVQSRQKQKDPEIC